MIGNTTLFTTVLICEEAVVQVPSIAPATSPSANADMDITDIAAIIMIAIKITLVVFFFIKNHPFYSVRRTYVPVVKNIALNR